MSCVSTDPLLLPRAPREFNECAENLLHLEPCFYVGAALRHGRRPLSTEALDRLIVSLERLAIMGNATAPIALAWLIEKQAAIKEAR
ncbi:hypothetical protein [Aurantimonas coralicida]|uniref:hypothetical protein n=1 Tax=Aurantimonas coralicida TaxID=182270 RepID=UPI001E32562D|nr:hypothetical protein [Aurantimonas coralicida]MCD1645361.1 hypothetical protein [Aurantimonas coralicida]